MGKASSLRFVSQVPRGVRILVASPDPSISTPLAAGLRADGHEVLVIGAPSELVFAMEVVDHALGPAPDILVLDADLGATIEGRLAHGQIFFLLDADFERHMALVDSVDLENLTFFRKPVEPDDVRTAALNLETWKRARQVQPPKRVDRAFEELTLTVEGENQ